MKKMILIVLGCAVILFFIVRLNNDPSQSIASLIDDSLSYQGALCYKINFMSVIPVGKAFIYPEKMGDYEGKQVYHLSAKAQTLKLFSRVFSATASLDSYADIKTRAPLFFRQVLSVSGKKEEVKEVFYDQVNGVMLLKGVKRQIPAQTQDPLSLLFNLQHMDFDQLREFEMNLNTNQKNYTIKASVKPREGWINKKQYRLFIVNAEVFRKDKNPYHKSKITMVLLKGKKNIPVLIRVFASGAVINAKLSRMK